MSTQSLTPQDLQLFHEGKMFNAYHYFGAHCVTEDGLAGVRLPFGHPVQRRYMWWGTLTNGGDSRVP